MVLFGNKLDKESDRQVSKDDAEKWCAENSGIPYYETSATENVSVEDAFLCMVKRALEREKSNKTSVPGPMLRDPNKRIKLGKDDEKSTRREAKKACDC